MSEHEYENQNKTMGPAEYIRANFEPSDRIAVLVRNPKRGETTQRISTTAKVADTPFQEWMRYKNDRDGCDIYVGMNALKALRSPAPSTMFSLYGTSMRTWITMGPRRSRPLKNPRSCQHRTMS